MPKLTSFYTVTSVTLQNTNRKAFPAANACHLLTPILLLSSTDPVDRSRLRRCSEACQAWSLPVSHAAQLAAVAGGRRWSEQLQQPGFSGSRAPSRPRLPATVQPRSGLAALRILWRAEGQWGKMHVVFQGSLKNTLPSSTQTHSHVHALRDTVPAKMFSTYHS